MSGQTPQVPPTSAMAPFLLWMNLLEVLVAALFYGVYIILFARAVQILLQRIQQLERQGILLGAMTVLFILSTSQLFVLTLKAAVVVGEARMALNAVETASLLIYVTSCICSDLLLIYRCYVIWNDNRAVVVVPVCLLITSSVFGYMCNTRIFQIISLATVVFVTFLTVSKVVWAAYERRGLLTGPLRKTYISAGSAILESGFIYALFVSIHFTASSRGAPAAAVIFGAVGQIVGIAPTLIIVRSGLPPAPPSYVKTSGMLSSPVISVSPGSSKV
ncbi:Zn(2)-C6 fungal-type domain-containing protein [Mycena sanguinolenta]|uniref:Zn(2)-C6 fungal-type domain-containing protein n=1 Tax=Mycena sanguinolenta TaxID=230812 RepID=A0A8H6XNL0_9AGAR|nr:Zn(2)-C6 fungal-type domain-containing protein [Mycena sanguinolenta]